MTGTTTPPVKRGRGRPPIGRRIVTHLPDDVLAEVDRLAADAEMTRAEVVRGLLVTALRTRTPAHGL